MSTTSHGMEYGQFGSAILAGSSVSLLPLPLLGQRKETKLWFPGWEMEPTGLSPTRTHHHQPPSRRPQAGGARRWQGAPPVQCTQPDKKMVHIEGCASARAAPVKKEKGGMFVVRVFVCASKSYSCWGSAGLSGWTSLCQGAVMNEFLILPALCVQLLLFL